MTEAEKENVIDYIKSKGDAVERIELFYEEGNTLTIQRTDVGMIEESYGIIQYVNVLIRPQCVLKSINIPLEQDNIQNYTIYCSKEQTKKARILGAPIEVPPHSFCLDEDKLEKYKFVDLGNEYLVIPTTEQMIGWIEGQSDIEEVHIFENWREAWVYKLMIGKGEKCKCINRGGMEGFSSRKEATLAAIDAALEYLHHTK